MKKVFLFSLLATGLLIASCGAKKEEVNQDSLQNVEADSLLQAALADTASTKLDTVKSSK